MSDLVHDPERADQVAEILKALAHPLRVRIVSSLIHEGTCNVNALAQTFGVPQSLVSQHLKILRMRHLVSATRRDGFAWYTLAEPRLVELLRCLDACKAR